TAAARIPRSDLPKPPGSGHWFPPGDRSGRRWRTSVGWGFGGYFRKRGNPGETFRFAAGGRRVNGRKRRAEPASKCQASVRFWWILHRIRAQSRDDDAFPPLDSSAAGTGAGFV